MSLYQKSQGDLAAILTAAAGVTIAPTDFTVVGVRATVAEDNSSFNTKLALQATTTGSYQGQTYVFYDRLDLGSLPNFNPYKLSVAAGVNVYDMLSTLRNQYGIRFTTDDLVNHATVDNGDGTYSLLLEAKSTSIGWFGSGTVLFAGQPNLATAFMTTTLPSL